MIDDEIMDLRLWAYVLPYELFDLWEEHFGV